MTKIQVTKLLTPHLDSVVRTDEDLLSLMERSGSFRVQTVNLHHLALARNSEEFRETLASADWITADGWPVVKCLKSLGVETNRVTGSEFVERLTVTSSLQDQRIGLLGATEEVGDKWESMLHIREKSLCFREHGQVAEWVPDLLAKKALEAKVDVLLVAVTPPHGDNIAARIIKAGFSGKIISVGGSIDMVTGVQVRAPLFLQKIGLEWFYRLAHAPRRLARRYLVECLPVFGEIMIMSIVLRNNSRKLN